MSAQRHAEEPESVYTEFDISDHLERQRDVSQFIRDSEPANEKIAQLDETLAEGLDLDGKEISWSLDGDALRVEVEGEADERRSPPE